MDSPDDAGIDSTGERDAGPARRSARAATIGGLLLVAAIVAAAVVLLGGGDRPARSGDPGLGFASDYTSADGAVVVPAGWGKKWFGYRATRGRAERREFVVFGDSTTRGSGPDNYSWLQRLRDRAVESGMADGGKGMFGASENSAAGVTIYDPPEINGIIARSGFDEAPDVHDNLGGAYLVDTARPGSVRFQFRSTGARLWYSKRAAARSFTYRVDGGAPVAVDARLASEPPESRFVYISGLAPNETHTVEVSNSGTGECRVAFAPVNARGFSVQKHAIDGSTLSNIFFSGAASAPYTQRLDGGQHQSALGLSPAAVQGSDGYAGARVDTSYAATARVKPVLAAMDLGFNDLNSANTDTPALYAEAVRRFAAACRAASCDGVVLSGQLPYHPLWPTYGEPRFKAMKDTAFAEGLAFVDLFEPVGGPSLSYSGVPADPHLTRPQYVAQADFLWDRLLGLARQSVSGATRP